MSTAKVKVVALRSPNRKEQGHFNLSIEIVPKKNADSIIKKRQNEYDVDNCIMPPTSPDIVLPLDKDKNCEVKFAIEGGLKPAAVMHDGEDIIVYSDKRKTDARKILLIIPNNESDKASIVFKVGDKFKHRINIVDVPCQTETVSPGLAAMSISEGATSGDQTSVMMANTETSSAELKTSYRGDTTELKTSYRGGDTSYERGDLAKPVNPTSGLTYVPAVSYDAVGGAMPVPSTTLTSVASGLSVQEGSSYEAEESAYTTLISSKSLKVLAGVISPNDFNALIIHLEVPAATIQQERRNHPGDIGSANFECLLHWRSKGENTQEADKRLFDKLIEALTEIKRNDIMRALLKVLNEGPRHLKEKDFPHM
ncbi:uncharacterized protein LOC128238272 isoform X2 [Mya arenaria]|uniref:uncharacterized protein LOC128238272 isoform X2 n=1 Tax=Mya arenaria TaxID=6604 RepID=UPI0022E2842F|nr:uncharacterized protein LOC128238272 isoform X2 [Mya arenaria]